MIPLSPWARLKVCCWHYLCCWGRAMVDPKTWGVIRWP